MKKRGMVLALCFGFVFYTYPVFSDQADNASSQADAYKVKQVVKTVDNLNFVVQEDRPIVKVGGVYQPVSLDAYVVYKFNELEKKMNETDADFAQKITDLSKKIEIIGQKVDAQAAAQAAQKNETRK